MKTSTQQCQDGTICPKDTVCYDTGLMGFDCMYPDQLTDCVGMADDVQCNINGAVTGLCNGGVCLPAACGDGFLHDPEECDGTQLGKYSNCNQIGYYDDKPLQCTDGCHYNRDLCTGRCGDGIVQTPQEFCEIGMPPQETCVDVGYAAGFIDCGLCAPDLSDCRFFGWQAGAVTAGAIEAVHGASDTDVFAVGQGEFSHFDGHAWSPVDLSACPNNASVFYAVYDAGGGEAFAVGDYGIIVHVSTSGCTAVTLGDSFTVQFDDVWGTSAANVYAATRFGPIGLYHYDGTNWTPVAGVGTAQYRVWGAAANDIYTGYQSQLFHFDGTSWSPIVLSSLGDLAAIFGTSKTDVYVGGIDYSNAAIVYHYDGVSWQPIFHGPSASLLTTGFASPGHALIALSATPNRFYDFDGTDWKDLPLPDPANPIQRMWGSPRGDVFVTEGLARVDHFSGTARFDDAAPLGAGSALHARSANEVYGVISASLSVWDGAQWTTDTSISSLRDVWLGPNATEIAIGTDAHVYKRVSGGAWTDVVASIYTPLRVWGPSETDLWLLDPIEAEHFDGGTIDDCATCESPNAERQWAIWGAATNDVYIVGANGMVRHYDGASWSSLTVPTTQTLFAVDGTSSNDVWAAGAAGTILHYDGSAWRDLSIATPGSFKSIAAIAPNDVFVGGNGGVLYHYDGAHLAPVTSGAAPYIIPLMTSGGDELFYLDSGNYMHRLIRTSPW